MKQTYHSNAVTNIHLRCENSKSNLSAKALSLKYDVSEKTINKWKNRTRFVDKSSRPHHIKYALSELDKLIAVELRAMTWWALDEITEAIHPEAPEKIRSAVYRTFVREGINQGPVNEKEKAKKFKEYQPG